jgi:hypothetical protein
MKDPGQRLRLGLDIVRRQQSGVGKALGEIEQDGGDFGQRTAVDDEGRDLAFRIEREKFGRAHVVLLERHRLGLEGDTDLVQRDMRGKRAGAGSEVECEHFWSPKLATNSASS